MSQETIQKQKLTPEQVFPKWSMYLDYIVDVNKREEDICVRHELTRIKRKSSNIEIGSCQKCFVGEAWKFNDDYWSKAECNECCIFSGTERNTVKDRITFVEVYNDVRMGEITDWRNSPVVKDFLQHYEEVHLK